MTGARRDEAFAAVRGAQASLRAVATLLAACERSRPESRADEEWAMTMLFALESARTARCETVRTIEALMELMAEAQVPWQQMGIAAPGDE